MEIEVNFESLLPFDVWSSVVYSWSCIRGYGGGFVSHLIAIKDNIILIHCQMENWLKDVD